MVQETMVKVWNRRDSWGTIDNIENFCLTICANSDALFEMTRKLTLTIVSNFYLTCFTWKDRGLGV